MYFISKKAIRLYNEKEIEIQNSVKKYAMIGKYYEYLPLCDRHSNFLFKYSNNMQKTIKKLNENIIQVDEFNFGASSFLYVSDNCLNSYQTFNTEICINPFLNINMIINLVYYGKMSKKLEFKRPFSSLELIEILSSSNLIECHIDVIGVYNIRCNKCNNFCFSSSIKNGMCYDCEKKERMQNGVKCTYCNTKKNILKERGFCDYTCKEKFQKMMKIKRLNRVFTHHINDVLKLIYSDDTHIESKYNSKIKRINRLIEKI